MPPFDRRRAEWYLAGLVVWVTGWVLVVLRSGGTGRQTITDLAGAIQLLSMFAACALISGIAFLFARESAVSEPSQLQSPTPPWLPFLIRLFILNGSLLVGLGLPSAWRSAFGRRN
jgi:hypothetical protein